MSPRESSTYLISETKNNSENEKSKTESYLKTLKDKFLTGMLGTSFL